MKVSDSISFNRAGEPHLPFAKYPLNRLGYPLFSRSLREVGFKVVAHGKLGSGAALTCHRQDLALADGPRKPDVVLSGEVQYLYFSPARFLLSIITLLKIRLIRVW